MSRGTQDQQLERCRVFAYGAITLWGRAFQRVLLTPHFVTLLLTQCYCLTTPSSTFVTDFVEILTLEIISWVFFPLRSITKVGLGFYSVVKGRSDGKTISANYYIFINRHFCILKATEMTGQK